LDNPFLSLVKSTEREDGIMWNQVVSSKSCPIVAKASAQQFPSLYLWVQIIDNPSCMQLCQRFRKRIGMSDWFLKERTALDESLSNHNLDQLWLAAYSIASIRPVSSASKTVPKTRLLEKPPRKAPVWSLKIPPQDSWWINWIVDGLKWLEKDSLRLYCAIYP